MADRVLCISWGAPVRGAEARAIGVFNDALGLLGRMQQEGRIEGFDVVLLAPNAELDGYITIRGTADQINALREDEEFQRNTVRVWGLVELPWRISASVAYGYGSGNRFNATVSTAPSR